MLSYETTKQCDIIVRRMDKEIFRASPNDLHRAYIKRFLERYRKDK